MVGEGLVGTLSEVVGAVVPEGSAGLFAAPQAARLKTMARTQIIEISFFIMIISFSFL
jgi:hypothetical protein